MVTGSRTWSDVRTIRKVLSGLYRPGALLVSGACPRGADYIAEAVWRALGGEVERHPADWAKYGRAAGYRRNVVMAHLGADICVAFVRDNSPGTTSMINLAIRANIPVRKYEWQVDLGGDGGEQQRAHHAPRDLWDRREGVVPVEEAGQVGAAADDQGDGGPADG